MEELAAAVFSYMRTGIETGEGILSHENTNQSDVSFARAKAPTRISSVIQEAGKYETTWLKFGSGSKNRYDYGKGSDGVPQNGNIVEVLEEVNTEGVY